MKGWKGGRVEGTGGVWQDGAIKDMWCTCVVVVLFSPLPTACLPHRFTPSRCSRSLSSGSYRHHCTSHTCTPAHAHTHTHRGGNGGGTSRSDGGGNTTAAAPGYDSTAALGAATESPGWPATWNLSRSTMTFPDGNHSGFANDERAALDARYGLVVYGWELRVCITAVVASPRSATSTSVQTISHAVSSPIAPYTCRVL